MSSVMGPGPAPKPHNAGYPPESYAMRNPNPSSREFNGNGFNSNGRPNRPPIAPRGRPPPGYPQGQQQRPNRMPPQGAQTQYYNQVQHQRPTMYNRPRTASSTSSNGSTAMSQDSIADPRMASPSTSRSSFTSFDSLDLNQRKPEQGWQRPAPIKQNRIRRAPGEVFAALPDEVLELILDKLKKAHLQPGSDSCATYEDIQLVGTDSPAQRKRYKLPHGARLVLLRRTLRAKPQIAALVHSLKVPAIPADAPSDRYQNLVASIVMACPNFERLAGFHQEYDHSFNRLFYALSTREQLKDMTWVIGASPSQRGQVTTTKGARSGSFGGMLNQGSGSGRSNSVNNNNNANNNNNNNGGNRNRTGTLGRKSSAASSSPPPQAQLEDLHPDQSASFLELHANWAQLTTLTIHCRPGATLTPVSLLGTMMAHLPALEALHLSHLPPGAFNDMNLLSLPPLQTLSLSDMPGNGGGGISDSGLAAFARRPSSRALRSLTLRRVGVGSLPVLGRLLSHLTSLESLALVQPAAPALPDGEMIWLFPYVASASLRKLHWDITGASSSSNSNPTTTTMTTTTTTTPKNPNANLSDSILARSIAAGGFPALRVLRAPNDPDGLFQALCKPEARIERASDRLYSIQRQASRGNAGGLIARAGNNNSATTAAAAEPQPQTPTTPKTPTWSSSLGFMFPSSSSSSTAAASEAQQQQSGTENTSKEPTSATSEEAPPLPPPRCTNLAQGRIAAQSRLEAAWSTPKFVVQVVDEEGRNAERFHLGGFLGEVGSRIRYCLEPDAGAGDESGGLVEVADLLRTNRDDGSASGGGSGDNSEERRGGGMDREGAGAGAGPGIGEGERWCSGRWNARDIGDKRDRERWWHVERARWTGGDIRLS
ncbi:hypothetical protein SLS62_007701 [Diatrype stigma]|uniref:F-box domain-containing protein n=1 Tax=Diatrype stigma TaxID=117547 RepID=A0AAN9UPB9_9PEZI